MHMRFPSTAIFRERFAVCFSLELALFRNLPMEWIVFWTLGLVSRQTPDWICVRQKVF